MKYPFLFLATVALFAGCFQDTTSTTESAKLCVTPDAVQLNGRLSFSLELKSCGDVSVTINSIALSSAKLQGDFIKTLPPSQIMKLQFTYQTRQTKKDSLTIFSSAGTVKIPVNP